MEGWPVLLLESCGLYHTPPWLCYLVGLRELSLAGNCIAELSDSLQPLLPSLERLDLSGNHLNYLPEYILEASPEFLKQAKLPPQPQCTVATVNPNPNAGLHRRKSRLRRHERSDAVGRRQALFYFRHSVHIW